MNIFFSFKYLFLILFKGSIYPTNARLYTSPVVAVYAKRYNKFIPVSLIVKQKLSSSSLIYNIIYLTPIIISFAYLGSKTLNYFFNYMLSSSFFLSIAIILLKDIFP